MTRLLASPRRRRRLTWLAVLAIVTGGVAVLSLRYGSSGHEEPSHFAKGTEQRVAPNPRTVLLTSSARAAVTTVARAFVTTAVFRRSVGDSWKLTTPTFRQGLSQAEWATGAIPVIPFPVQDAASVQWNLHYSYRNRVGYWVAILAKHGAATRSQTFQLELRDERNGGRDHWLVSYWAPAGFSPVNEPRTGTLGTLANARGRGRVGAIWLLVPVIVILGTILLLPTVLLVRSRIQRRRVRLAEDARRKSLATEG